VMGLGGVAALSGDAAVAVRLLAGAQGQLGKLGAALRPIDRAALDRALSATQRLLGDSAFAAAFGQGTPATIEEALAAAQSMNVRPPA
jgi:hypothetical protein